MQECKHNSKPLFLNGAAATPAKTNNKKFWEFRNAADTGGTAELLLYGYISETSWMGDEVTPKEFAADLATIPATEDLTVRICSGGGDVWAAQAIGALLENRIGTGGQVVEGQKNYMKLVNDLIFGFDDLEVCKFLVDELGFSGCHHDGEKFNEIVKNSKLVAKFKKKKN